MPGSALGAKEAAVNKGQNARFLGTYILVGAMVPNRTPYIIQRICWTVIIQAGGFGSAGAGGYFGVIGEGP